MIHAIYNCFLTSAYMYYNWPNVFYFLYSWTFWHYLCPKTNISSSINEYMAINKRWTKLWLSNELTFSFLALSAGLSVHMDRSLRSGPALTRKVRAVSPMFWPIQSGNSIIHASRFGWPSDWVWIKRDVIVHFLKSWILTLKA